MNLIVSLLSPPILYLVYQKSQHPLSLWKKLLLCVFIVFYTILMVLCTGSSVMNLIEEIRKMFQFVCLSPMLLQLLLPVVFVNLFSCFVSASTTLQSDPKHSPNHCSPLSMTQFLLKLDRSPVIHLYLLLPIQISCLPPSPRSLHLGPSFLPFPSSLSL